MWKWIAIVSCLVLLAGCGGGSDSTTTAGLGGRWVTLPTVPGSSTTLQLTTNGSQVTGSGTYSIEAGRSGTLQAAGTQSGSSFSLSLVYDGTTMATFQGSMTDSSHLSGTVHRADNIEFTLSMARQ